MRCNGAPVEMSAAATRSSRTPTLREPAPARAKIASARPRMESVKPRFESGFIRRSAGRESLVPAVGDRPDAVAYHEAACDLAEALEGMALRHGKVLEVLDVGRARACRAAAVAARDAASRFRMWIKWDLPLAQRTADLAIWREAQRAASELGIAADRFAPHRND